MLNLDLAIAHQGAVDVVNAHGAVVRAGHAAECGLVSRRSGIVHVKEMARRSAHVLHQLSGCWVMLRDRVLPPKRDHGDHTPPQRQIQKRDNCPVNRFPALLHTHSFAWLKRLNSSGMVWETLQSL